MLVNFTKMHSLGNDFVLFDGISQTIQLRRTLVKRIADRCFGVGCNQVLVIEPPKSCNCDFFLRIYNADGLEAEHCGNGARCAARFVLKQGLSNKATLRMECLAGQAELTMQENNLVNIDMGALRPEIEQVQVNEHGLDVIYVLSLGNPHAVCIVKELEAINLFFLNDYIGKLPCFSNGVNVSFACVLNDKIKLRVFERGCGETHACGTAAAATFLVAQHLQLCPTKQSVIEFQFGNLQANIDDRQHLHIIGATTSVFSGCMRI